jgi:hypothetical protein
MILGKSRFIVPTKDRFFETFVDYKSLTKYLEPNINVIVAEKTAEVRNLG